MGSGVECPAQRRSPNMAWQEGGRRAWTWYRGEWLEGNPMLMGPMTHAPWLGSCVFDAPGPSRVSPPISTSIASASCDRPRASASRCEAGRRDRGVDPRRHRPVSEGRRALPETDVLGGGWFRRRRSGLDRVFGVGLRLAAPETDRLFGDTVRRSGAPRSSSRPPMRRQPAIIPIRRAPSARPGSAASTMR